MLHGRFHVIIIIVYLKVLSLNKSENCKEEFTDHIV